MNGRVVIVQPYVPTYRVPFFVALRERLAADDVELVVAAGSPARAQALRGDAADLPGAVQLVERRLVVGSRSVVVRDVRDVTRHADLIVLEQARRNIEAYQLLYRKRSCPVALWGHGRTTTRDVLGWEHRLLDTMTRRADWFFAYTDSGAAYVRDLGLPLNRITVVRNSVDTLELAVLRDQVTAEEVAALRARYGLVPGRTGLFIGGLDSSKRLDFLSTRSTGSDVRYRASGCSWRESGRGR
jgi:hypothetical protein